MTATRLYLVLIVWLCAAVLSAQTADSFRDHSEIRGRIVDEQGQPLANALVKVGFGRQLDREKGLRTGADGRFCLPVPPLRIVRTSYDRFLLEASAKGRLSARWWVPGGAYHNNVAPPDRDLDVGDIALPIGVPFKCTVRQEDGKPMAGAEAVALDVRSNVFRFYFQVRSPPLLFSRAVTDARGRAVLFGLPAANSAVHVRAPGYFMHFEPVAGPRFPLDVQLTQSGFVEGQVVDARGRPTRAAILQFYESGYQVPDLFRSLTGSYIPVTETDANGRFKVTRDLPGRLRFRAGASQGPGRSANVYGGARSKLFSGPEKGYRYELDEKSSSPGFLKLEVSDAEGKPVRRFKAVSVWSRPGYLNESYMSSRFATMGSVGKAGETRLPGPIGSEASTGKVMVCAPGFAPFFSEEFTWDAQKPVVVKAQLKPEVRLKGVVRDGKGKPVSGARIEIQRHLLVQTPGQTKKRSVYTNGSPLAGGLVGGVSGADGKFSIGALCPGKYRLRVTHPRRSPGSYKTVEVPVGGLDKLLKLTTPPGKVYKARLSKPVPKGTRIILRSRSGSGLIQQRIMGTQQIRPIGADGSFEFDPMPKGRYQAFLEFASRDSDPRPFIAYLSAPSLYRATPVKLVPNLPSRVTGRISFQGLRIPVTRLLVGCVASGTRYFVSSQPFSRAVSPAADGSFSLMASGSTAQLTVVDAATMVPLAKKKLNLTPGKDVVWNVSLQLGQVRVRFSGEEPAPAVWATILNEGVPTTYNGMRVKPNGMMLHSGFPVPRDGRSQTLYLPLTELQFAVRSQAYMLREISRTGVETVGQVEFTPIADRTQRVELHVDPPEIDDGTPAAGKGGVRAPGRR